MATAWRNGDPWRNGGVTAADMARRDVRPGNVAISVCKYVVSAWRVGIIKQPGGGGPALLQHGVSAARHIDKRWPAAAE